MTRKQKAEQQKAASQQQQSPKKPRQENDNGRQPERKSSSRDCPEDYKELRKVTDNCRSTLTHKIRRHGRRRLRNAEGRLMDQLSVSDCLVATKAERGTKTERGHGGSSKISEAILSYMGSEQYTRTRS
ncbi:hypothetical protein MLD38_040211 [Melastoma candidum]|uniref:Uncharacterized protein n=1 Tax=Melastoma candidum TaxID=119954 RepID=A0ACB9L503_9MYRT|nr:hypothetical protein MLD38_040211 [Melastoma candidum]